jgi:hypothetical protein
LIGGVFALAVAWKLVLSPDYLDASAFRVILVADSRLSDLAIVLGGIDDSTLDALRQELLGRESLTRATQVDYPAGLGRLADLLTVWTAGIESLLALAFLAPIRSRRTSPVARILSRLGRLRDPLLAVFAATTYAVASVEGFAWTLLAMACAQAEPEAPTARLTWRRIHAGLYLLILIRVRVPWGDLLR